MPCSKARHPLPESVLGVPRCSSVFSELPASGTRGLAGGGCGVVAPPTGATMEGGPCVHGGSPGQPRMCAAGPRGRLFVFWP